MADEADGILAQNLHYTTVADTRIMITRALHHKFLKTKIPHDEVERLYKLLEENPESESIRNEFFDMLDESVDAGNRRNYFNQHIIREAINDAKYNPMSGSEKKKKKKGQTHAKKRIATKSDPTDQEI